VRRRGNSKQSYLNVMGGEAGREEQREG
jgi:hypothetical protein